MNRLGRIKDKLLGRSRTPSPHDGGSGGSTSSVARAPVLGPVLPSQPARSAASETTSVPANIVDAPPDHLLPSGPRQAASGSLADPWARAYKISIEREPELTADYAKHLSSVGGEAAAVIDFSAPRSVEASVKQLLEAREKKQWRVSLLGRDIKLREQAERMAKFVLWSDPLVKSALSNQPYAALAWSGVSLLLPLIIGSTTQHDAMLGGFNAIGDLQVYWKICEETYLQSGYREHYEQLIEPLAKLYSYVIEYQARVICHLSRAQLSRAWHNVAGWNDWNKAEDVEKLSRHCSDCIVHLNEGEIRERWRCQLREMQQTRSILDDIRQILEDGGRWTERTYDDQKERDLLQDLASDYEGYKNFNPQKVEGTCEWFHNDERFRKWRDSDTSSLLWVSAGPGCGKSVLSRALIDDHRLSTNVTTSTVCHFFFKDGDERRMYSANALCAILHQLFTHDHAGSLIGNALPSHKNYGQKLTENFSELWRILLDCVKSPDAGQVVCILDALDECEKRSRDELINNLKAVKINKLTLSNLWVFESKLPSSGARPA